MNPNAKLLELVARMRKLVETVHGRVPFEGPVLGWRGFHMDLDDIDDLTRQLRLGARGVFESDGADLSESPAGEEP